VGGGLTSFTLDDTGYVGSQIAQPAARLSHFFT
jgi:hypothetical protein